MPLLFQLRQTRLDASDFDVAHRQVTECRQDVFLADKNRCASGTLAWGSCGTSVARGDRRPQARHFALLLLAVPGDSLLWFTAACSWERGAGHVDSHTIS